MLKNSLILKKILSILHPIILNSNLRLYNSFYDIFCISGSMNHNLRLKVICENKKAQCLAYKLKVFFYNKAY